MKRISLLTMAMLASTLLLNCNMLLAADQNNTEVASILSKAEAKDKLLRPAIQLDAITPIKNSEQKGDEIYVSIAEFNSNNKSRHYTIPQSPVYWPSQGLDKIQHFQLWQGKLPVGDASEVVISLIEQDAPPWDLDDLIGLVKIKMRNENGKIVYAWYHDNQLISKNRKTITVLLTGSDGVYKATLSLLLRDSTKAQASPDSMKDAK